MPSPTTERSVADVLRAAKERISDPERWTTIVHARNQHGARVEPPDATACRWCVAGAVLAELGLTSYVDFSEPRGDHLAAFERLLDAAAKAQRTVASINDNDGHEAALALLDTAIELAEAEA